MSDLSSKRYDYPVFGTQGGGLVREIKTNSGYGYIFVEKPDCPGLDVGDMMPEEWGIIPANSEAENASALDDLFPEREEFYPHRF